MLLDVGYQYVGRPSINGEQERPPNAFGLCLKRVSQA